MEAALTVRFAIEADAEWCVRVATLDSPDFVRRTPGVNEMVVAVLGGSLVGLLQLNFLWRGHEGGTPYVSSIQVLWEHRRKGIGKAMLLFVEKYLRDAGHKLLMSSSTGNEPEPQAWHRRVGFVECGFFAGAPFEDGIGEVFFAKALA